MNDQIVWRPCITGLTTYSPKGDGVVATKSTSYVCLWRASCRKKLGDRYLVFQIIFAATGVGNVKVVVNDEVVEELLGIGLIGERFYIIDTLNIPDNGFIRIELFASIEGNSDNRVFITPKSLFYTNDGNPDNLFYGYQSSVVTYQANPTSYEDNIQFEDNELEQKFNQIEANMKGLSNASIATVSAAYEQDTYLVGSNITVETGAWLAKTLYYCMFDMTKTAAGTASFVITVRMGTTGTTSDAAILTLTYGAGTAAADTGIFEVWVTFRSVGSGTSAVIQGVTRCNHLLANTGLTSTGAAGTGIILGTSAGFNSTISSVIGLSVNGGASFSGTNTMVRSMLSGI